MIQMQKAKKLIRPALAIGVAAVATTMFLSVSELKDPESEFALIRSELATIQHKINTATTLPKRQGLGPQTVEADENFASALNYYEIGEYAATVRMLNNYLNHSQVPDFNKYLKSQYLLGRTYEHLGRKDNAIRAYLRYVAAFLTATNSNHSEFLDVLRRTVSLSVDADEYSQEAGSLIASLTSLDLPSDVKNIVNVIAAKSAVRNRNNNVAARLLEETLKDSKDPTLKAKALYIKALLAISQKDLNSAEEYLADATHADVDGTTKDMARLALARIAAKRGKLESALKFYMQISEDSEQFRDALFESVYAHINNNEDPQARAKALLFLSRYRDTAEAVQLRMILAYLDLRAGDFGAARSTLEIADKRVRDVDQYLYTNLIHKNSITSSDVSTLSALTAGHIDDVPAIKEATALFSRLSSIQKTLSDIDSEIRSIAFVTSQTPLEGQNPSWVNRSEQLAAIGDELLVIGHRMIATERYLYERNLDDLAKGKLSFSENRRSKLLAHNVTLKRTHLNWKSYRNYLVVHQTLRDSGVRLASAEAELASLKLAAANQNSNAILTSGEVSEVSKKVARMRRDHDELSRQASLTRVKHSGLDGPHHGARLFLSQYVQAIEEESQVLAPARESQKSTAYKLLASDAKEQWDQWRYAIGTVLEGFNELDKEINGSLSDSAQRLDDLSSRQRALTSRMYTIIGNLEGSLGTQLHSILNGYSAALSRKSSRTKKWRADIDWLEFQQKQKEETNLTQKFDLEKQILDENLRDIRQGLIW